MEQVKEKTRVICSTFFLLKIWILFCMHCRHVLRNSLHQIEMNGKKMLYIISSQRNMLFPSKDDFRHKREDHFKCISWRLLTRLTFNFKDAQLLSCHLIKSLNLMSELVGIQSTYYESKKNCIHLCFTINALTNPSLNISRNSENSHSNCVQ